jgi:chloride channel 2
MSEVVLDVKRSSFVDEFLASIDCGDSLYDDYESLDMFASIDTEQQVRQRVSGAAPLPADDAGDSKHAKMPENAKNWRNTFSALVDGAQIRWSQSTVHEQSWLLLLLLGALSAIVGLTLDACISQLYHLRVFVSSNGTSVALNWLAWMLWSVPFTAVAVGSVVYVSPWAAGSGVPEMKALMSGVMVRATLSLRTLLARAVGLVGAFAGGLSIGKEGPYIAICASIGHWLAERPAFARLRRCGGAAGVLQVIQAGCAAGVTAAFGAPIGGVLFSAEITSSYMFLESLWKALFCTAMAWLFITLLGGVQVVEFFSTFAQANGGVHRYHLIELVAFVAVGAVGGLLGAAFVRLMAAIVRQPPAAATSTSTSTVAESDEHGRYALVVGRVRCAYGRVAALVVERVPMRVRELWPHGGEFARAIALGLLIAALTYAFPLLRNYTPDVFSYLFHDEPEKPWYELVPLLVAKFAVTVASLSVARVPAGVFSPLFVMGAIYGRLCGEMLALVAPAFGIVVHPAYYSVVGAAALAGSATQTLSTAVVAVELTGQVHLLLPLLLGVLVATAVARRHSPGVFDMLLHSHDVPYIAGVQLCRPPSGADASAAATGAGSDSRSAFSVAVQQDLHFLTLDSRYTEARALIETHRHRSYPIVRSSAERIFIGTAQRADIAQALAHVDDDDVEDDSPIHWRQQSSEESSLLVDAAPNQIAIDESAFHLPHSTSLVKTHFIFSMLGLNVAFLTRQGQLCGLVTRRQLVERHRPILSDTLF